MVLFRAALSFNRIVVTRYRMFLEDRRLAPGTINGRLAAVRRLANEAADLGLWIPGDGDRDSDLMPITIPKGYR